jgi:nitrite reductase/ring-hydroxylating ferredoxin subunit/DMSO/TMAO reductase YedYZ heme-binding membrane subunit
MSDHYRAIDWNRQKRRYDAILGGGVVLGAAAFLGMTAWISPESTAETLILRTTSVLAFFLLHILLAIGPLARLDPRFLPLLYNRRHLGVTIFLLALVHGLLATIQFHALGDENPLVSLFTAYSRDYRVWSDGRWQLAHFPFEPFGVLALGVLLILAALSHDFWLKQLGAGWWKACHLLVYPAYVLLMAHVAFGILQTERSPVYPILLGIGFLMITTLHLLAAAREKVRKTSAASASSDGFVAVGSISDLPEGQARVLHVGGQRVALVRHQDRWFATGNVCRHQGGPLGEGRVVNGCLTCPWHGWNYQPEDGCSPPPFDEVIPTYRLRWVDGQLWIHPTPLPPRTASPGVAIPANGLGLRSKGSP